jgi:sigma-B regulation protein RsbU (phosphoserine phosphatase)
MSFFTAIIGWIVSIYGFLLGVFFITFSFKTLYIFSLKWIPVAVIAATLLQYIQFGLLTRLGVPAFFRSHRVLNNAFRSGFKVDKSELGTLFNHLTMLPAHNAVSCIFYTILVGVMLIGAGFFEYRINGSFTIMEFKTINRIVVLGVVIGMILYGVSAYLLSSTLIAREKAVVYNKMIFRNQKVNPRSLITLKGEFIFLLFLTVITVITYAALMEKNRYEYSYSPGFTVFYIGLFVVTSLVLMQVLFYSLMRVIVDIQFLSREISSNRRAVFSVLAAENDFLSIQHNLVEMTVDLNIHRRDLETMVEQRTRELQEALSDLKNRDAQIQKQLDMASVIQRSILPGRIDDWNELKFAVRYLAMEKIGGDFYDIHQLKDDKLGILIADVSGHGIPAALVTTMAKISFGNAGARFDSPKAIFQEVNQNILDHVKTQDYMTCFMVAIDDEYNVVYSNASHQKGILLRREPGEVELLDTDGLFIGAVEEARGTYDEKVTRLNYGDRIILYTDGIPEAVNESRREYSNRRLEEVIIRQKDLPLEDFVDSIIEDVQRFVGSVQLEDDITLLVIELARDEAVDIIKNSKKLVNSHEYNEHQLPGKGLERYPTTRNIYNLAKIFQDKQL